jgi:hypothetical protein
MRETRTLCVHLFEASSYGGNPGVSGNARAGLFDAEVSDWAEHIFTC